MITPPPELYRSSLRAGKGGSSLNSMDPDLDSFRYFFIKFFLLLLSVYLNLSSVRTARSKPVHWTSLCAVFLDFYLLLRYPVMSVYPIVVVFSLIGLVLRSDERVNRVWAGVSIVTAIAAGWLVPTEGTGATLPVTSLELVLLSITLVGGLLVRKISVFIFPRIPFFSAHSKTVALSAVHGLTPLWSAVAVKSAMADGISIFSRFAIVAISLTATLASRRAVMVLSGGLSQQSPFTPTFLKDYSSMCLLLSGMFVGDLCVSQIAISTFLAFALRKSTEPIKVPEPEPIASTVNIEIPTKNVRKRFEMYSNEISDDHTVSVELPPPIASMSPEPPLEYALAMEKNIIFQDGPLTETHLHSEDEDTLMNRLAASTHTY